jgi:hypothetical protein
MIPSELNVDQTIHYAADQFEVAINDSDAYTTSPSFTTIKTGFLDQFLNPLLYTAITGGVVDETELHHSVSESGDSSMTSVLRGRDPAAFAIDSTVYVTYSTNQVQVVTPPQTSIPGFPTLPVILGVTVPFILPGPHTARQICIDLCARVGLGCLYQAPDYTLREDVAVNGPVLQAIQNLVASFSHFERSKVDIWVENKTLIVRSRAGTDGKTPTAGPGVSMSVHDARISNLMIRTRFLGYIRVLRLSGAGNGVGVAVDPGTIDTETTDELTNAGVLVSRIVTHETKRVLDGAVKHQFIETYKDPNDGGGFRLVSTEDVTSDWDDLQIVFPNTVVNSPKEKRRVIVLSGVDSTSHLFVPQHRTTIIHAYDPSNFLSAQETIKEDWDSTASKGKGGWVPASSETKQYRDNGPGMYQITTCQYGGDGSPGQAQRTTALGTRPGGPGRGSTPNVNDSPPFTVGVIISTLPSAKDVTISDRNLLPQHLQIILAQARAAHGATESEMSFTAAGMPWLHRGQYIQLTGLFKEDGTTPIPLNNALLSEVKHEYRESNPKPTFLSHVKALWWTQ